MLRVFGQTVSLRMILLGFAELMVLVLLIGMMRPQELATGATLDPSWIEYALLTALFAGVGLYAVGLYDTSRTDDYRGVALKTVCAILLLLPLNYAATFLFHDQLYGGQEFARTAWLLKAPLVIAAAVFITRLSLDQVMRAETFQRPVYLLGRGNLAGKIRDAANRRENKFFRIVGSSHQDEVTVGDLGWLDTVAKSGAKEIVVALDDRRGFPTGDLLAARLRGLKVTDYNTFCEREFARFDLDALQPAWMVFADWTIGSRTGDAMKRGLDIAVSLAMMTVAGPLMLFTALAVKLADGGPVFYAQERVGLNGRTFRLLKFRSMRVDAEAQGPRWASTNDSRVTPIGKFLRTTRLDELPQLFNVLKNEMSLIGPRPERPVFVEKLAAELPFYRDRHAVKPGLTGWAQVNFRYAASEADSRTKLEYDLYYVKNRNLVLDLATLVSTVHVVLFREGSR